MCWPDTISNEGLYSMTATRPITEEIRRRRCRWIGHVLRLPPTETARVALRWTPDGRRGRGSRKTKGNLEENSGDRDEATGMDIASFLERAAQDRNKWKDLVEALCDNDINDKHNNN